MSDKVDPSTLALRAPPPVVTRLNRRTLLVLAALLAALVFGVALWSLQRGPRFARDTPVELHQVDHIARAEGLDQLPSDYTKVSPAKPATAPILGPPLPGDLGNAMFHAQHDADPNAVPGLDRAPLRPDPAADAARMERLARQHEAEDAAKAPLFFHSDAGHGPVHAAAPAASGPVTAQGSEAAFSPPAATNAAAASTGPATSHDEKRQFLVQSASASNITSQRLQLPISPYQLMAGTVIAAALMTGIDSDLPGQVLATVTEPVYDTATGRHVLIPQGTRLIGEYDNQVAFGQRRVLLVWNRLIFPDASSLVLDRLPGVDAQGRAGLEDGVDRHWRELASGAALSTLIGIAAELAAPDRDAGQAQLVVSTRQSLQDTVNQAGQALTRHNLDLQPTLTIRAGYPLRVIVSRDLVLRPYQPLFVDRSSP